MQAMTRVNILSASAGSGKTFRLVLKYICDVLKRPECYRNILAVTFTNKATEEMKSRIINELHNLAENHDSAYLEDIKKNTGYSEEKIRTQAVVARTQILHDYSRFTVLTIDRFFQRILRAFINELSLDQFKEISPEYGEDVHEVFNLDRAFSLRTNPGAPSAANTARRIAHWKSLLG